MIASAGIRSTRPPAAKLARHQPSRSAALQDRGDAEPGEEGTKAADERAPEEATQMGSEGALNAALHHVQAPQQQRNRAGKVDQGQGGVQLIRPSHVRAARAAARQRLNGVAACSSREKCSGATEPTATPASGPVVEALTPVPRRSASGATLPLACVSANDRNPPRLRQSEPALPTAELGS